MNADIVIEKGIPNPITDPRSNLKMALLAMEVGDSFVIPLSRREAFQQAYWRLRKDNPDLRFTSRKIEKGGDTIRVWKLQ